MTAKVATKVCDDCMATMLSFAKLLLTQNRL